MINNNKAGGSSARNPFYLGLPKLKSGGVITPSTINNLSYAVDKFAIKTAKGYRVERNNGGTVLRINQPNYLVNPIIPFQCSLHQTNSIWKVSSTVGTVNGIIPKIGGKYLDDYRGDGYPMLTFSEEGFVCLAIIRDEKSYFPKNVEMVFIEGDDMSEINDTENVGYKCIATVKKLEGNMFRITNLVYGNFCVNRVKAGTSGAIYTWGYE